VLWSHRQWKSYLTVNPFFVWRLQGGNEYKSGSWESLTGNDRIIVDLLRVYNTSSSIPSHDRVRFQLYHMNGNQLLSLIVMSHDGGVTSNNILNLSGCKTNNLFPRNSKMNYAQPGQILMLASALGCISEVLNHRGPLCSNCHLDEAR
jgi:hypothetical protein